MLSHIAPKDNLNWSLLLLLLFLHFCLGQEENLEVSRRDNSPVAKVLESHHQTGHKGSSSRENLRQRSQLYKWTVEAVDGNSPSTDQSALKPDVDDVAQTTSDRVQVL